MADATWVNVYDADGNPIGVAKAADIAPLAVPVRKADEQRFVLGIAYQAGPDPRIAKGADGGRDFFTEAELEKAAWSFMLNGQQHGLLHLDGSTGAARPVESSSDPERDPVGCQRRRGGAQGDGPVRHGGGALRQPG